MRPSGLRPVRDILPQQFDRALRDTNFAREHIDQCRLACAVGTDYRMDLALCQFERNVGYRGESAKTPSDTSCAKQWRVAVSHGLLPIACARATPATDREFRSARWA